MQYRHIQSDLLSKCNPAVEHSASRHLPAIYWQFQYPSQQFPLHLSAGLGLRPVFIVCTALFLSEVTVWCCTAFSTNICLFTCGAILLGIESAPLSEDGDELFSFTYLLQLTLIFLRCCRGQAWASTYASSTHSLSVEHWDITYAR